MAPGVKLQRVNRSILVDPQNSRGSTEMPGLIRNREYNFDPLCLELANHFLADDAPEDSRNDLAQVIQDAVEAHLQREPNSEKAIRR